MDALHGGVAEAALWDIDNALKLQVIVGVGDNLEIRNRILDFLAFIKSRAADNPIGNTQSYEAIFNDAHLKRCPHQNSNFVQGMLGALQVLKVIANRAGFGFVIPEIGNCDFRA